MKNWKLKGLTMLAAAAAVLMTGRLDVSAAGVRDVFDAEYYANTYADVKAVFGDDEEALFQHYVNYGLEEGRDTSATFNLSEYRDGYADLQAAFGDNWDAYAEHYLACGIAEGRTIGVRTGAAADSTGMTLGQWVMSQECKEAEQLVNEMVADAGMVIGLQADGNTLVYVYTLKSEAWGNMTAAELKPFFDAAELNGFIETQRGLCELLSQQFKEVYGIQLDGVRFVFIAPDGIPFYSGEIKIN